MITDTRSRLPVYSIAVLSAAALGYEILLVRLLSIIQWHHYAAMIISLALLGYGVSGTVLALFQKRLLQWFRFYYLTNIVLFGLTSLLCFLFAQQWSFHPEELLFSVGQWRNLVFIYLSLAVPFFFAANAIGLALICYREQLSKLYAADLIGAGLGSLAIILVLFFVFPDTALRFISLLGLMAVLIAVLETGPVKRPAWILLLALLVIPIFLPGAWLQPSLSPYKDLSQALRVTGTSIIDQRSSPLGLIAVMESTKIPLRYAPEASLHLASEPPAQLGMFIDGNGPTVITRMSGESHLDYLAQFTSALPYALKVPENVLVLGAGGGTAVLQGLQLGAQKVTAVELNPQIIGLVKTTYADYAGHLYNDERVQVINREARGFLTASEQQFDLIQLPLPGGVGASATGLYSLSEDYLHTVEAFRYYLDHLTPGGYLMINSWVKLPPRDTLKIIATAIAALKETGVRDIDQHLAVIRGWQTSGVLIKKDNFSTKEIEALKAFCEQRSFDVSFYPGITREEVNRFNLLSEPFYYLGTRALLGKGADYYLGEYKFNLTAARDNRPFFYHYFKWDSLSEILSLYGRGGAALIDTGYLVSVATLLQAILASVFLVLLPVYFFQRKRSLQQHSISRSKVLVYFTALGLAFLFIEIAFIQKLMLFLHHPLYAVAVTLTAFLIFAGLGSAWSQRQLDIKGTLTIGIVRPVIVIFLLGLSYLLLLDKLFAGAIQLSDSVRVFISIAIIAPLAFCMGIPFPRGLTQLGRQAPELMPWAWGINGCASVISAVLASLIAIHIGFNAVIVIAILLYIIAAQYFP
ncbi:MAG: SAM-dependent methyltransferase [Gammaproteobacteria bacterium]|nr:SAM-dependent methyltransferase [Gammaproteobacteria bacterium]NIN62504.1 SAM-dependent methyltransferase [Gammaproteobacteria bacterium]NIO63068.1 SAM-dependent methyltransferase [Gammaproteobacteria bacterium]NIP48444.1 SAM-dependent methyltransferase [Gammaproteobacteria bacterium]NIQ08478.1 SAM-dependent methyltransferase [Gammaproteobacteria bacterium]